MVKIRTHKIRMLQNPHASQSGHLFYSNMSGFWSILIKSQIEDGRYYVSITSSLTLFYQFDETLDQKFKIIAQCHIIAHQLFNRFHFNFLHLNIKAVILNSTHCTVPSAYYFYYKNNVVSTDNNLKVVKKNVCFLSKPIIFVKI